MYRLRGCFRAAGAPLHSSFLSSCQPTTFQLTICVLLPSLQSLARRADVAAVHALVRAKDAAAAMTRLRSTCAKRGIDRSIDFEGWFAKVVAVNGDVGAERLGLTAEAYESLAASVDCVVHAAAEVNMIKPASVLAPANVGGTSNVLSFALRASIPTLFTSTILPLDGAMPTGYRQSKEAAEVVCVTAAKEHGAVCAALQLGDIGIAATEGSLPDDDYMVIILRVCMALGLFPTADWSAFTAFTAFTAFAAFHSLHNRRFRPSAPTADLRCLPQYAQVCEHHGRRRLR